MQIYYILKRRINSMQWWMEIDRTGEGRLLMRTDCAWSFCNGIIMMVMLEEEGQRKEGDTCKKVVIKEETLFLVICKLGLEIFFYVFVPWRADNKWWNSARNNILIYLLFKIIIHIFTRVNF